MQNCTSEQSTFAQTSSAVSLCRRLLHLQEVPHIPAEAARIELAVVLVAFGVFEQILEVLHEILASTLVVVGDVIAAHSAIFQLRGYLFLVVRPDRELLIA